MLRIEITANIDDKKPIVDEAISKYGLKEKDILSYKIHHKSLDARRNRDVKYLYQIDFELNNENLLVTMQGLEGYAFAGEGSIGVVLDTNITDELREEGHVREMISKIQNMRKDKGFEVADKIKLYVADNDMLLTVIKKYAEVIKKETLTQEIVYNTEADYSDTFINCENLKMTVEVVR